MEHNYIVTVDADAENTFFGLDRYSNEYYNAYAELVDWSNEYNSEVYEVHSPASLDSWLDTRPGVQGWERLPLVN